MGNGCHHARRVNQQLHHAYLRTAISWAMRSSSVARRCPVSAKVSRSSASPWGRLATVNFRVVNLLRALTTASRSQGSNAAPSGIAHPILTWGSSVFATGTLSNALNRAQHPNAAKQSASVSRRSHATSFRNSDAALNAAILSARRVTTFSDSAGFTPALVDGCDDTQNSQNTRNSKRFTMRQRRIHKWVRYARARPFTISTR